MKTLWKYADNTFEVVTRGSFKLMNILIIDHYARCTQLAAAAPGNQLLLDALTDATSAQSGWQADYTAWNTCRGQYKGFTLAFHNKLEELSSLKIRQWDAAIQAVYLEGTPEYITLLPQGREPFQKGAFDQRVNAVRTLGNTLAGHALLAPLMGLVNTYLGEMESLRTAQQSKEGEVDTCSAMLENTRKATARLMYRNLGRFMQLYWDDPVKIEDCYDMNYIRDGSTPPPEDEPAPSPSPSPTP